MFGELYKYQMQSIFIVNTKPITLQLISMEDILLKLSSARY